MLLAQDSRSDSCKLVGFVASVPFGPLPLPLVSFSVLAPFSRGRKPRRGSLSMGTLAAQASRPVADGVSLLEYDLVRRLAWTRTH